MKLMKGQLHINLKAWPGAAVRWLWGVVRNQWLATTLIIPLAFMGVQIHVAHEDAKDARRQGILVDRVAKIQDSGKTLDVALAAYFQATAELGLAERHVTDPSTGEIANVADAKKAVSDARKGAEKAFADHSGDVDSNRGTLDPAAAANYVATLTDVSATIEGAPDVLKTKQYVTALARMVKARHDLVDRSLARAS